MLKANYLLRIIQISIYIQADALTSEPPGKPRREENKRKKEFNLEAWEKETSNTVSLKKKMKWQRNTTQMKEQARNPEVQIKERK